LVRAQRGSPFLSTSSCGRGGMADAPDLGSGGATRGGSTPLARTKLEKETGECLFSGFFFLHDKVVMTKYK
jgi:hypothetical protein